MADGGQGAASGVTLGYNINQINTFMQDIVDTLAKVKDEMAKPFPEVQQVMVTEWKGPDEIAAEKSFIGGLNECYLNCAVVVVNAITNIYSAAKGWRDYTVNNAIEHGVAVNAEELPEIKMPDMVVNHDESGNQVGAFEISGDAGANNLGLEATTSFDGENVGIVSASSGATISTAIDTYRTTVRTAIEGLYDEFGDISKVSFLGETQATAIFNYMKKIGSVVEDVVTHFQKLQDAVKAAADAYVSAETKVASDFNTTSDSTSVNFGDGGQQ